MEEFEIYFDDLTEQVQSELLEFMNIKDSKDGNYDVFPIAVIYK